ncbi:hypothetical protein BOTBODRAFT_62512 [Botryobasidium botryosum FD-172 SS1]|uniref:F-box domain-containing protein n=1 Tax=Botryobasidium botryosum (strain FD-172 SS1) TaxID=930990 RepID=A0A067MX41_BOTB1|nr:hypothetical protein BOTBODRAFT_62512 [Botryobasidium botryosum FD-172 SS1]
MDSDTIVLQIIGLVGQLTATQHTKSPDEAKIGVKSETVLASPQETVYGWRESLVPLDQELNRFAQARDLVVDAIDAYMQTATSEIKSRRNQLLPISRLPPEIYSLIFELVDRVDPLDLSRWQISQVSKRWREIALNTPRMWARIDGSPLGLTKICVSRSKGALLMIDSSDRKPYDIDSNFDDDFSDISSELCTAEEMFEDQMTALGPHIHRWRSLILENVRASVFWPLLGVPAPYLEKLNIYLEAHDPDEPPQLPHDLFDGVVPHLRYLHLERVFIPLTSSIYAGLTELAIKFVDFSPFTTEKFLDVLRSCPLLESLQLRQVHMTTSTFKSHPFIDLPRLSSLSLGDLPSRAIHNILATICSPSLKYLLAEGGLDVSEPLISAFPFNTSANFRQMLRALPVDGLRFTFSEPSPTPPSDMHCICTAGEASGSDILSLRLEFTSLPHDSLASNLFGYLRQNLLYPKLRSLSMTGLTQRCSNTSEFAELLGDLPKLQHLKLVSCEPSFISILGATSDQCLCPQLTELSIYRCLIDGESLVDLAESRRALAQTMGDGGAVGLHTLSFIGRLFDRNTESRLEEIIPVTRFGGDLPEWAFRALM